MNVGSSVFYLLKMKYRDSLSLCCILRVENSQTTAAAIVQWPSEFRFGTAALDNCQPDSAVIVQRGQKSSCAKKLLDNRSLQNTGILQKKSKLPPVCSRNGQLPLIEFRNSPTNLQKPENHRKKGQLRLARQ